MSDTTSEAGDDTDLEDDIQSAIDLRDD